MTAAIFKQGIEQTLRTVGFERRRKALRRHATDVVTVIDFDKSRDRWHLGVGFWIKELDANVPDRVPACHLYYRLEDLFPEHRNVLADAGVLDGPRQDEAYDKVLKLLRGTLGNSLKELETVDALRAALLAGRLDEGFIRKEARAHLEGGR
jgi:hypothetical protein